MAKFVLAYKGGGSMGEDPVEQKKIMEQWMNWFGGLGESVVDMGSPFGPGCTVKSDGSTRDVSSSQLSGYSIIEAQSVADAASKAKGCPVLSGGGEIEVYEAMPIG
jgi:hypothetical protein